jgi:exodeoxyribonuclease VII small subunit
MPRTPKAAAAEPPPASYEQALSELDGLVAAMEAGDLPLDQLLASHQRASVLLAHCRGQLAAVEQQVQVLQDRDNAVAAPDAE